MHVTIESQSGKESAFHEFLQACQPDGPISLSVVRCSFYSTLGSAAACTTEEAESV